MFRLASFAILPCILLFAPPAPAAEDVSPLPMIIADEVEHLAIPVLEVRSARGDLKAKAELGARFARGDGVAADMKRAITLFEQAAKQGEPNAQYYLGTAYDMGVGGKKDPAQAVQWFSQAAAKNHAGAQYALGVMMTDGQGGLTADPQGAAALVAKSAEQGYVPAALRMANLHIAGLGVPRDTEKAADWYRRILKTHINPQATVGLATLIATREATWRPEDPGLPPPPLAVEQPKIETAAILPVRPRPKTGRVATKRFKSDGGITFESKVEDGRLSLYSTSDKPFNCEIWTTFTYLDQNDKRQKGDWLCFKASRPAGRRVYLCETAHENFFYKTDVTSVELKQCTDPEQK